MTSTAVFFTTPMSWLYAVPEVKVEFNIDNIARVVSDYFGVPVKQMQAKTRKREVVVPRQIALYLMHRVGGFGCVKCGRYFNRDHSTVLSACENVSALMKYYPQVNDYVEQLIDNLECGTKLRVKPAIKVKDTPRPIPPYISPLMRSGGVPPTIAPIEPEPIRFTRPAAVYSNQKSLYK